jgi:hypothetical protein
MVSLEEGDRAAGNEYSVNNYGQAPCFWRPGYDGMIIASKVNVTVT